MLDLGIYDTMQYVSSDVATICTLRWRRRWLRCCLWPGLRASALLCVTAGDDTPAYGWRQGQASDIEITAREIQKLKKELYTIIADHSGMSYDRVAQDSDRDYWMTAEEARDYGMIDEVLVKAKH